MEPTEFWKISRAITKPSAKISRVQLLMLKDEINRLIRIEDKLIRAKMKKITMKESDWAKTLLEIENT